MEMWQESRQFQKIQKSVRGQIPSMTAIGSILDAEEKNGAHA
jgi:hypothetical protein